MSSPTSEEPASSEGTTRSKGSRGTAAGTGSDPAAEPPRRGGKSISNNLLTPELDPHGKTLRAALDGLGKADTNKVEKTLLSAVQKGRHSKDLEEAVTAIYTLAENANGRHISAWHLQHFTFEAVCRAKGVDEDGGIATELLEMAPDGDQLVDPPGEGDETAVVAYDFTAPVSTAAAGSFGSGVGIKPDPDGPTGGGGVKPDPEAKASADGLSSKSSTSPSPTPSTRSGSSLQHPQLGVRAMSGLEAAALVEEQKLWVKRISQGKPHFWREMCSNHATLERLRDVWNRTQQLLFELLYRVVGKLVKDTGSLKGKDSILSHIEEKMQMVNKKKAFNVFSGFANRTKLDAALVVSYAGTEHLSLLVSLLEPASVTGVLEKCRELLTLEDAKFVGKSALQILTAVEKQIREFELGDGSSSPPIDASLVKPLLILAAFETYLPDGQNLGYVNYDQHMTDISLSYLRAIQCPRSDTDTFQQAREAPSVIATRVKHLCSHEWTRDLPSNVARSVTKKSKPKKTAGAGAAESTSRGGGGRGRSREQSRGAGRGRGRSSSSRSNSSTQFKQRNFLPPPRARIEKLLPEGHKIHEDALSMLFNKTQPDKNGQSHLSVTWRTLRDQYNRWSNWQSVKLSNRLMENLESKTTSTDYQYIILSPEHDLTYEDLEEFSGTDYLYLLMLLGKVPKQSVDRYERETNQSFYLWAEDEGDDQSQGGGGGSVAASAHRSSQPSSSRRSLKKIELKKGPGKDGTAATPAPSAPPAPAPGPPFPGTGPYGVFPSQQSPSVVTPGAPPWVNPNMMSGPGSGGMPPSIMPMPLTSQPPFAQYGVGDYRGISYGDGSVEPTMSDEQRFVHLQQQQFHQQQQQQRSMEAMQHIDQKLSELASTQAAQAADLRKGVESVAEATNNVIDAVNGDPSPDHGIDHDQEEVKQDANPV